MSKLFSELMEKQSPPPQPASAPVVIDESNVAKKEQPSLAPGGPKGQLKGERSGEAKKPWYHDTKIPINQDALIETIRKAVRQLGKEAATYRFTEEEKRALADIVYTYKSRGIRTSENEITRISIHALIEEYRATGETSVLARVLERLNE